MNHLVRVSLAEFQNAFGSWVEKAATAPIAITKDGRDHLVLLSADEYARLQPRYRRLHIANRA